MQHATSLSMPSALASLTPTSSATRLRISVPRLAAARARRWRHSLQRTRSGGSSSRARWPTSCCGCVPLDPRASPGRASCWAGSRPEGWNVPKDKTPLKLVEPHVDAETRIHDDHHLSVRLWLRMLACTNRIESFVRQRLQANFATTLPRFDLMAQLERAAHGLKMSELSQRMMVTGGNVTGITDGLEKEGL